MVFELPLHIIDRIFKEMALTRRSVLIMVIIDTLAPLRVLYFLSRQLRLLHTLVLKRFLIGR